MSTTRETSLLDSLKARLDDSDALATDSILAEIEATEPYLSPGHADHITFLKMRPLALARQMTLAGDSPYLSGTDADSSMADNQVYTHELYEEEKPLTFDDEDKAYETKRANVQQHLQDLQAGKVSGMDDENLPHFIEATQKQILQMDREQDAAITVRETELKRIDDLEDSWADERAAQTKQMKTDFMAVRMKNILPEERPERQRLAELEWGRLKQDYGF